MLTGVNSLELWWLSMWEFLEGGVGKVAVYTAAVRGRFWGYSVE